MQGVLGEYSVTTLAVAPEARRRGLGRALMQALIAVCREESALFLTLEVRASNAAAIALYRSLGFAAEGPPARIFTKTPGGRPAAHAAVLPGT